MYRNMFDGDLRPFSVLSTYAKMKIHFEPAVLSILGAVMKKL